MSWLLSAMMGRATLWTPACWSLAKQRSQRCCSLGLNGQSLCCCRPSELPAGCPAKLSRLIAVSLLPALGQWRQTAWQSALVHGAGPGQVAAVGAEQPSHRKDGGGQAHICHCRDGSTHPAPQQPLGKPHCGRVWHQLGAAARQGAAGSDRHSASLAPQSVAHCFAGGTAT